MSDEPRGNRPGVHEASVLMREVLQLSADVEKMLARELHVNGTDFDAMQHMIEAGPLSPSDLAERLGISTAAATIAVDRLVKVGHVRRQPHPSDRRRLLVVPEEESVRRAMDSLIPMIRETDALLERYTQAEQDAITDYLARTADILRRRLGRDTPTP